MGNLTSRIIIFACIAAVFPIAAPVRAETAPDAGAQFHVELRALYSQICGTCIVQGNGSHLSSSPKGGVQMYGDYLPFGTQTPLGELRVGAYGSMSAIGSIGKVAGGIAVTLRPADSPWEFFTQTGVRYTTEKMRYRWDDDDKASQGEGAFNLAFGARYYVGNTWYLSLTGEHDSNGRSIGLKMFPYNGGYNPGIDAVMVGAGWLF